MTVTVGEASTFGNGPEIAGERNGTLYWRPNALGLNAVLNPAGGAIQTPTLDARGMDTIGLYLTATVNVVVQLDVAVIDPYALGNIAKYLVNVATTNFQAGSGAGFNFGLYRAFGNNDTALIQANALGFVMIVINNTDAIKDSIMTAWVFGEAR